MNITRRSLFVALSKALLAVGFLWLPLASRAAQPVKSSNTPARYVKLEVKGKLIRKGAGYCVESSDAIWSDQKVVVMLERAEDKNRLLDKHLESLEGKIVVAQGFMDCRKIGSEAGVIYLHLREESQVTAADK